MDDRPDERVRELGRGGMGVVLETRRPSHQRLALELIRGDASPTR